METCPTKKKCESHSGGEIESFMMESKGIQKELLVCLSLHECKVEEKERHLCHQSTEFLDGVPLTDDFSAPDVF